MHSLQNGSKVYIEIVKQLRTMIEEDGLKPGDKIPSERELSERLIVGRSSVREALRALELLGLIETRRGEGTFIRDFRGNQLVQLLSTFILQDQKAKKDVTETKNLIELDCLQLVIQRDYEEEELVQLKSWVETTEFSDEEFFTRIVNLADNHLFYRIWIILNDYYKALNLQEISIDKQVYLQLIDALMSNEEVEVKKVFKKMRNLSNG